MMIDAAKWDPVAPLCMLKVIIYKFVQNDALRDSLMATFPKDIVEAAHYDYVWGVGKPEFNKYNEDGLLKESCILTSNAQDEISWQQPPTSWEGKNYLGKIETIVREMLGKINYFESKVVYVECLNVVLAAGLVNFDPEGWGF